MRMYRTPRLFERLYSDKTWSFSCQETAVYLTFDDGPTPEVTEWVLDKLHEFQAKATFFCVGNNVKKHPQLFERIQQEGHAFGNHTMNHKNGWKTDVQDYLNDVEQANEHIPTTLFRPPYGKLKRQQHKTIVQNHAVIMWSFLTYDFDPKADMQCAFEKFKKSFKSGDIIVLHDSVKAFNQMKLFLELILQWGIKNKVHFKAIPMK